MAENQTEMSLDEVLSSIKQMVVDKDPPVLELTDMISSDGTIVKIKHGQKDPKGKSELKDFLRLAQENGKDSALLKDLSLVKQQSADIRNQSESCSEADSASSSESNPSSDFELSSERASVPSEKSKGLPKHVSGKDFTNSDGAEITVNEIIREVAAPLIKDWLDKNLSNLVREVVTGEIRKMMKQG